MKKKTNNVLKIVLIILGVLVALVLIGALTFILYLTPATTATGSVQIANPASTNCVDLGGTLDIRLDDGGNQYGVCTKDGKECEEWALYRGECSF